MEIFVRIALHKFYKVQKDIVDQESKLTESGAIIKLFNELLLEQFKKYDCNKWRVEKLWNKTNDETIKSHLKTIKRLYETYSGKHTLPGKTKFTSLDEFMVMIGNSGILRSGYIGSGDIGSIFNVSMMTQVDELDNTRHMEMTMIEFIEAICRIASKLTEIPELKSIRRQRTLSFGLENEDDPEQLEEKKTTRRKPTKRDSYMTPIKGFNNQDLSSNISINNGTKSPFQNKKTDANDEDKDKQKWKLTNIANLPLHEKIDQFIKLLSVTN